MPDSDVILIRREETIVFFRPTSELGRKLRSGEDVNLLGNAFRNFGACCEWIEVADAKTKNPVGIMFVDFYESGEHQSIAGLRARNVAWNQQGEAICLFDSSNEWEPQSGPYLPVHFLASDTGQACYFVPEGLPLECALKASELREG